MMKKDDVHLYLLKYGSRLYLYLISASVEPIPPLHIRPGQLVELAVGFIVAPTGKVKLSLKRRFFSICVLDTSLQEVSFMITRCPLSETRLLKSGTLPGIQFHPTVTQTCRQTDSTEVFSVCKAKR
jgi:hypothetical protein